MPSNRVQPWLLNKQDSACTEEGPRLQTYSQKYHVHQQAAYKRSAAQGAAILCSEQSARQQLANEAPRILADLEAQARRKIATQVAISGAADMRASADVIMHSPGLQPSSSSAPLAPNGSIPTCAALEAFTNQASSTAVDQSMVAAGDDYDSTAPEDLLPQGSLCSSAAESQHCPLHGKFVQKQQQQQQQQQAPMLPTSSAHNIHVLQTMHFCSPPGSKKNPRSRHTAGHSSCSSSSTDSRSEQESCSWHRGPGPPNHTLQLPLLLWDAEGSIQEDSYCDVSTSNNRHSRSLGSNNTGRASPVAQMLSSCHATALAFSKNSSNAQVDPMLEPFLTDHL